MTVGEWQLERLRSEHEHTIIYRSRVYNPRLFIVYHCSNNGTILRPKVMGTEREEKMDGIDLMIAIIGAVVILTFYT